MPRGGKREGAGRKPRLKRYKKKLPEKERQQSTFSRRAVEIGSRYQELLREANTGRWKGQKRTGIHKKIEQQVAEKFGESIRMVRELAVDFRRLEADLIEDLDGELPV